MDLLVVMEHQSNRIRQWCVEFYANVMRLLRASPIFGSAVIATGLVLGCAPILLWRNFGKFIDACFASRGVGVMTTDLSHSAFMIGILSILLMIAGYYFLQTKALSRSIASIIAVAGIIATHLVALISIEKSTIVFLAILAIGFYVVRRRAAMIAMNVVLALLAVSAMWDILLMMTHRSMTVGDAIEYCLVILTLAVISAWIARR